jgi:hypothetical protein
LQLLRYSCWYMFHQIWSGRHGCSRNQVTSQSIVKIGGGIKTTPTNNQHHTTTTTTTAGSSYNTIRSYMPSTTITGHGSDFNILKSLQQSEWS